MIEILKISGDELIAMIGQNKSLQFIDMSDQELGNGLPFETTAIAFPKIEANINQINKHGLVVLACKHGEKSFFASHLLQTKYGFSNLRSLAAGIESLVKLINES